MAEPKKHLKDFEFLTRLSSALNREIGVCICDGGQSTITFGDECSGQIHCGRCETSPLLFHTHPGGMAHPSIGDIKHLMDIKEDLNNIGYCVGAMNGDKPEVNCFTVTKQGNTLKIQTGFLRSR